MRLDRISIEPSRFCSKGCSFCYNGSSRMGREGFNAGEIVALGADCAAHGVRFLSLGGGEPLEWPGLFDALEGLRGVLGRSFTTNGLPFVSNPNLYGRCARAQPDNIHISIHRPENSQEVERVIHQVQKLWQLGLTAGINLLVRKSALAEAKRAAERMSASGFTAQSVVMLPARGVASETPSPREVAAVAAPFGTFQSMSCLRGCGRSERFASIGADRTVAWCSYTISRRPLRELTYGAVVRALEGLELLSCERAMVRDFAPSP